MPRLRELDGGGDASEASSHDCDGHAVVPCRQDSLQLRVMAAHVLRDRLANPLLGLLVGQTVSAQQLFLSAQGQAGDRPAHGEALEQHLRAPVPEVIRGRGRDADGLP